MQHEAGLVFWAIQGPGWLLLLYLILAQGLSALSYDLGVRMGSQEPAAQITPVGVAFWWGLAFADLVFYAPLLGAGLIGHWSGASWGGPALAAALGVTVYWPVVCLATVVAARGAPGWQLRKEYQYWVVLPIIAAWAAWALWQLLAGS